MYYYKFNASIGDAKYEPPIIREKLQISLWRVDNHDIVKTKDRYFTIQNRRFNTNECGELVLINSLDSENIIIMEKPMIGNTSSIVTILDAFTLETVSEHEITISRKSDIYEEDIRYSDKYTFKNLTLIDFSQAAFKSVICWDSGR